MAVIPAKAGIQSMQIKAWIPAFAGMTKSAGVTEAKKIVVMQITRPRERL